LGAIDPGTRPIGRKIEHGSREFHANNPFFSLGIDGEANFEHIGVPLPFSGNSV
jgi:hypothetical protein